MKLLMVSRWIWEEQRRNGGEPGFFGELVQAIAATGADLTILSQADDAIIAPQLRTFAGLKLYVFSREHKRPFLSLVDKVLKPWSGYRKAATDAAIIQDFVQGHGPFDAVIAQCEEPDGMACALATRRRKFPPLITFVHDLRYKFSPGHVRFVHKSSLGYVFSKSRRVVANSEQTAGWLQKEYGVPAKKIGQCRIHLTAPFLATSAKKVTSIELGKRRILFLGALNRKKAPDVFVRAASLLASRLPGWTFALAGPETSDDPSFRAELKKLSSDPSLSERIEWLGRLSPENVIHQIRDARVVVCPSRIETFSRTTIEALALGRPVIVTETTGAAQWVLSTGCGSVVKPDDPAALAEAIAEWAEKTPPTGTAQAVTSQLTAVQAAQDVIREVRAVVRR